MSWFFWFAMVPWTALNVGLVVKIYMHERTVSEVTVYKITEGDN